MRCRWSDDRGSGSILAVALTAGMLCLAGVCAPLLAALPALQKTAGAADASALAAADVASGALPGVPCDAAGRVARANGVALARCEVDGTIVTTSVSTLVAGFHIAASATAGSPDGGGK
ncbi:Rv3654c family TadE-like protein [Lacisediminihabitans changchengi]|uniref:Flp pilus-assembly TadE/G-like family protein n=1 Tax=Lacisediminihabitans changchengi TaxID=2787634 RepID=A0A934W4C5_9MICO|nr:Rv3654c family TadE-like protein [Lacisediminihabitans changchengi]MBK4348811.1 flp pilus-assembly TadE/G-like family protein [Lacisediminihabitans changchengi]